MTRKPCPKEISCIAPLSGGPNGNQSAIGIYKRHEWTGSAHDVYIFLLVLEWKKTPCGHASSPSSCLQILPSFSVLTIVSYVLLFACPVQRCPVRSVICLHLCLLFAAFHFVYSSSAAEVSQAVLWMTVSSCAYPPICHFIA